MPNVLPMGIMIFVGKLCFCILENNFSFYHSTGSNGNNYLFLLKGHEDLRQDERVMQLFGLVNTLLMNDPKTFRHNLTIQVWNESAF